MKIEVSNGEIIDKYTILSIKQKKVTNISLLERIEEELKYLNTLVAGIDIPSVLITDLYNINLKLWDIEDKIRMKERKCDFGESFIQLARSVYIYNDQRGDLKRQINERSHSKFTEIKQYPICVNKFIFYNYLPSLANHVLDLSRETYLKDGITPKWDNNIFDPNNVKKGEKIFVKVDLLQTFFTIYYPKIKQPFILLSGVGDLSPSINYKKFVDTEKIIKWIGCNFTWKHDKIINVPIGFGENERCKGGKAGGEGGDQELLYNNHVRRKAFDKKKHQILITHFNNTHKKRGELTSLQNDSNLIEICEKKDFAEYLETLNEYKFILCPRGNGIDTHRFWEACLVGSVPIIESGKMDYFFEQFPCIIIDSFQNITEERINEYVYKNEENIYNFLYLNRLEKMITSI